MKVNEHAPKKALNSACLKQAVGREQIELFKSGFIHLLNQLNDTESEEFHKNALSGFLKTTD